MNNKLSKKNIIIKISTLSVICFSLFAINNEIESRKIEEDKPSLNRNDIKNPLNVDERTESKPKYDINKKNENKSSQSEIDNKESVVSIPNNKVILNFENADIQSVIKAISKLSGKNFVIDPRVKGTINIVSQEPILKVDSYKVLETALRMQGFATVEADGVIKVLPENDAKSYGMKTISSENPSLKLKTGDQVITKVFTVDRGSAMQLSNALRSLVSPNNVISAYSTNNALIVTDYSSNMERITKIINQLTKAGNGVGEPVVVILKNSIAADMAMILQAYLQNGNASGVMGGGYSGGLNTGEGVNVNITVDANTNSIILYSLSKAKVNEIKNLAIKLDQNNSELQNNLHVVYLKNADSKHVAEVLRVVANSQDNPDLTASSANTQFTTPPTSVFSAGNMGSGGSGGGLGSGLTQNVNKGSQNYSSQRQNNQNAPKVVIQAEPTTNSLIIQAPYAMYKNLRMIIDMLDIRRAQVMIEALIVDVTNNNSGAFGIQWLAGAGNNSVGGIIASNYAGNGANTASIAGNIAAAAQGGQNAATAISQIPNEVLIGLATGVVTVGGVTIPSIGVLADAIASTSSGNILSRPTIITTDNEEARLLVGQNVGVPNGNYQSTNAAPGQLATTFSRQNFGTQLMIKPLITQNGAVQLNIFQEVSSLDTSAANNKILNTSTNGPAFNMNNMQTSIVVDDGQIIALGGLTQDIVTIQQNGIPGLMDIPYLGWLFSWQARSVNKRNIVLFLRPVIIRNEEGYKALTNSRYQYVMSLQNQIQAKGNLMLPRVNPVNLNNQIPYKDSENVKGQEAHPVEIPIIDVRASKISNTNKGSQENEYKKLNSENTKINSDISDQPEITSINN